MLEYDFIAADTGKYTLELDVLSRNPVVMGEPMVLFVSINDGEMFKLDLVDDDFYAGHTCPQWCRGVLDNVRRITKDIEIKSGINKLTIFGGSPNVSFDKLILFNNKYGVRPSYLGPVESCPVSF